MAKAFLPRLRGPRNLGGGLSALVFAFAVAPAPALAKTPARPFTPAQAADLIVAAQTCQRLIGAFANDNRVSAVVAKHQGDLEYRMEYKVAAAVDRQIENESAFRAECDKIDKMLDAAVGSP